MPLTPHTIKSSSRAVLEARAGEIPGELLAAKSHGAWDRLKAEQELIKERLASLPAVETPLRLVNVWTRLGMGRARLAHTSNVYGDALTAVIGRDVPPDEHNWELVGTLDLTTGRLVPLSQLNTWAAVPASAA